MIRISNTDEIAPGILVRASNRGRVVYEVLETRKRGRYLEGRLKHTGTGRSVGWQYLDLMEIVGSTTADDLQLSQDELAALQWCVVHAMTAHSFSQLATPGSPPVVFADLKAKLSRIYADRFPESHVDEKDAA